MLEKMKSPLCVENKVRIATFAPQRNLTPEQIFWFIDNNNRKKAETLAPKPISALTVYPPNTPVKLVPRILPTKSITEGERGFEQTKRCYLTEVIPFFKNLKEHFVRVQTALFKEVKEMEEIFDQMNNEVDKNIVDKQCAEIEKKNLLIENENLIGKDDPFQTRLFVTSSGYSFCLHQSMAPVHMSSGPAPLIMTPGQLKSGLAPTDKELEMLFQPMFDEHLEQSQVNVQLCLQQLLKMHHEQVLHRQHPIFIFQSNLKNL
ncbi:hypothetical protein Tco_0130815, partial [Tanacetum coccineum]